MIELRHARDRKIFKHNMEMAKKAEEQMKKDRKALGLPRPKGSQRFNVTVFRPHQPRD